MTNEDNNCSECGKDIGVEECLNDGLPVCWECYEGEEDAK